MYRSQTGTTDCLDIVQKNPTYTLGLVQFHLQMSVDVQNLGYLHEHLIFTGSVTTLT